MARARRSPDPETTRSARWRAGAALLNGAAVPGAGIMGAVGVLAVVANPVGVLLLFRLREGEANIRLVGISGGNDALGEPGVVRHA